MICVFGPIPNPEEPGISPAERARREEAMRLLVEASSHPHIKVHWNAGSVLVVYQPNADIPFLGDIWTAPTQMSDITSDCVHLSDPAHRKNLPPYASSADNHTRALAANRRGSALRSRLRENEPTNPADI